MSKPKIFFGGLEPDKPVYLGIDQSYSGFAITLLDAENKTDYYSIVYKAEGLGVERLKNIQAFIMDTLFDYTIVDAAMEGYHPDKGFDYEHEPKTNHTDKERHWWVQAEAIVGALEAFRISNNEKYLDIALSTWQYIKNQLIDHKHGEWYWSRLENGETNTEQDKAGFWKCPYHNGRMCMEVLKFKIL